MTFIDETMKNPRDLGKRIFDETNSKYNKKKYNAHSKMSFNIIIFTRIAIFDKNRLHHSWPSRINFFFFSHYRYCNWSYDLEGENR